MDGIYDTDSDYNDTDDELEKYLDQQSRIRDYKILYDISEEENYEDSEPSPESEKSVVAPYEVHGAVYHTMFGEYYGDGLEDDLQSEECDLDEHNYEEAIVQEVTEEVARDTEEIAHKETRRNEYGQKESEEDTEILGSKSLNKATIELQVQSTMLWKVPRKRRRLNAPVRAVLTREEKLEIIKTASQATLYDPQTGDIRPAPLKVVSRKLKMNHSQLLCLVSEEEKIRSILPGRAHFSNECKPQSFMSEGYPGYLKLPLKELVSRGLLSKDNKLVEIYSFDCPVPFIGIENNHIFNFEEAHTLLKSSDSLHNHSGHPVVPNPSLSSILDTSDEFDMNSLEIYKAGWAFVGSSEEKRNLLALSVNKKLYNMAPDLELRARMHTASFSELKYDSTSLNTVKRCVSLVCQKLLLSSHKIISAIPVEIQKDFSCNNGPQQWAIVLNSEEYQVLLPLAISLRGPNTREVNASDELFLKGWTIDHGIVNGKGMKDAFVKYKRLYYKSLEKNFKLFHHSVILHVQDSEMIFQRAEKQWRARRFMSTWHLYKSPLHANYQAKLPFTPVEGTYMDLQILVDRVLEIGVRISLPGRVNKAFQLLRIEDFDLTRHHDWPERFDSIVQGLIKAVKNGETGPRLDQNHNEQRIRHLGRTKRNKTLERHLHRNAFFVDTKPKCNLKTCPFPVKKSTRYCEYHVTSLTDFVRSRVQLQEIKPEPLKPQPDMSLNWMYHLRLTDEAKMRLSEMKNFCTQNAANIWLVDFEFVQLTHGKSPAPVQMAIRNLAGHLLIDTNIDYSKSYVDFCSEIGENLGDKRISAEIFLRCYGSLESNGLRPLEIRERIMELGYSTETTQILSWGASQDMQCFQRLLCEGNDLIVPKHDHSVCGNFQHINVQQVCCCVFPRETVVSKSLEIVHGSIMEAQGKVFTSDWYHTAKNDTEAMWDVMMVLLGVGEDQR